MPSSHYIHVYSLLAILTEQKLITIHDTFDWAPVEGTIVDVRDIVAPTSTV